jgi:hypothetical protein
LSGPRDLPPEQGHIADPERLALRSRRHVRRADPVQRIHSADSKVKRYPLAQVRRDDGKDVLSVEGCNLANVEPLGECHHARETAPELAVLCRSATANSPSAGGA